MNITQHFVSNQNIPEFIKTDHSMFDTFIKAYYEWLELNNDSENSNYSDVYKAVGNPGYIINNNDKIVDVDETIDKFVDYFAKEVCPIALDEIQTNPKFFLKNIRDIYLAKGTPNSFKLFFKLYYNDDIDVFETGDTILRVSDGKYFAFPTAHFYVTDFEDQLNNIDFTLAELLDDSEKFVTTILSGDISGKTKQNESIVKAQFADDITLESGTYYIRSSDKLYTIQVGTMVSLSEVKIVKNAPLYNPNDPFYVDSLSLDRRFYGSITSVDSTGTIEGIKVRDRGIYYTVNDYFKFTDGDNTDGLFTITETGSNGDVLKIDNIPLRTGSSNNGFIATNLEDAYLPISKGGKFDNLPLVTYNNVTGFSETSSGNPYLKAGNTGIGLQVTPLSSTIGVAKSIEMNQETFFKDSDDVVINAPATLIIENNTLRVGDKIVFQKFGNLANYGPLTDDSETVIIGVNFIRQFTNNHPDVNVSVDSEFNRIANVAFPYAFDSETFEWQYKNIGLDTRTTSQDFWNPILEVLNSEGNIDYKIRKRVNYTQDVIDGGFGEPIIRVVVVHSFDNSNNQTQTLQTLNIPYSPNGLIAAVTYQSHTFDSLKDSEVFDSFKSFMNSSHGGNVSIDSVVMVDLDDIDGGTDLGASYDSEYDGGLLGEFYNDIVTSFDTFDGAYGKASIMKITFDDWLGDSEYIGNATFDEDSENITDTIDGGNSFDLVGSKVEYIEIEYEGSYLSKLSEYHFQQLQTVDSEILQVNIRSVEGNPNILDNNEDSDVGVWIDLPYGGEVIGISGNNQVVKVISYDGSVLPDQQTLDRLSSEEKYQLIKVSPIIKGKSVKDYSLPLTNIAHQIDRLDIEYKTSIVSSLFSKFCNQDGFISSDFGGTIQDNFYYSDYSYRIKSQLPLQDWKEKVKTMLHPAGMVMTSDYVQNLESQVTNSNADLYNSDNFTTNLTFDMQQEYVDRSSLSKGITTDGVYYKSNAFEAINILDNTATSLLSSNMTTITNLLYKQQSGNAWWDYEPIGWVRTNVDSDLTTYHKVVFDQYLNLDSEFFSNTYSTQNSDGNGKVANNYTYFQFFDKSKQDMYKNQSRVSKKYDKAMTISKVQFEESSILAYDIYDSDLPDNLFVTFADSDDNFRSIDYRRIINDNDNRYYPLYKIPRTWDIAILKEKDLNLAMREDGSLSFDDSDKVYYDMEAYERKWNQINNRRTRNNEGWSIKGYNQYVGYENIVQRNKKRSKSWVTDDKRQYTLKITPYNIDALEKDTLNWQRHYYAVGVINNVSVDYKYEKETYKDPRVSMKGRRRGR